MRHFVERKPPEEMQFHDAASPGIKDFQALQRLVQREHFDEVTLLPQEVIMEGDRLAGPSPLGGVALPRVIDQNLAHLVGSDGEEVRPVLPSDGRPFGKALPGFVYERSRLQGVVSPLAPHIGGCQAAHFAVYEGRKL